MMTIKPYSLTCAVLCLLFSAIVTPAFGLGDPNANSSNWTTYEYDGSYLPITDANDLWAEHDLSHAEADVLVVHLQTDIGGAPNPIPGDYALLFDNPNFMRYKADEEIAFNFDTGATMEMRFLNHFGTVNQAAYISMGDAAQNQDISLQFRNGPDRFVVYDGIADRTFEYGGGDDSELTVTDGFQIVRATVLGDVVNVYLNNDPNPIITTTQVRGGEYHPNGLGFGGKIITWELDYARWTNEGAFPPPSLPESPPSKFSHKWEGNFEGDELPYDGGNGWWSVAWFDSPAGQETQYEIDSTAFGDLPYQSVPGNPYGAKTENQYMNVESTVGALWYKAPFAEAFDFSTGATLEWRFKCHYGTMNSGQVFVEFGDGSNTLRPTFKYSDNGQHGGNYPNGVMVFNGGAGNEAIYPIDMHSNVLGNDYHTFRFVCLGNDFSLYVDNNSVPALTGTTDTRPGEQAINNLRFGSKTMQVDFDYVRWTKAGAFPPSTDCELLWEGTIGGVPQDLNQDCSVDELDLVLWFNAWLDCNDPVGCP
jgi:hypothetical protein